MANNRFIRFGSQVASTQFENACFIPGTTTTTLTLYGRLNVAPGVGASRTFTAFLENVTTGIALVISGATTTGVISGSVTVNTYDRVAVRHNQAGGPAAAVGAVTVMLQ